MCVCALTREGVEIYLQNEFVYLCPLVVSPSVSLSLFYLLRLFPRIIVFFVSVCPFFRLIVCACVSLCVSCASVHVCLCVRM